MEYYAKKLCVSAQELVDSGIMSYGCYKKMANRGRIEVVRRGGGPSNYALVAYDSIPHDYKEKVIELYPDGDKVRLKGWICSNYEVDQAAVCFFHSQEQLGLSAEKIHEYVVNASVLNCCIRLFEHASTCQKIMGRKYKWDQMAKAIEALRDVYGHTLPASTLRFRKKVSEYQQKGYACLISGKFGNQSARKVDYRTERLILSLAVLPNKPYNTTTHENYISFVCGELDVFDLHTGEVFNPDDFTDKNGEPKYLSESTIANVLNKPANKMMIEEKLSSWTTFMHEQMPHVHRHGGNWSLSQVTMDDVDLTRKLKDTKQRVHAYYAYDVVSQCVIGASYGRKKDDGLVTDCFRDMFRLIERMGWGMPAGIEVENHLMTKYRDGFLQAGVAFPFVHFCAPQNSQEKYAEPLNGAKKRSVIHKNHEGIGRFYGKGKWRTESKKIFDENNDTYEDNEYFSWDQLVAEDRRDSYEWNHQLHPNQKMFPGMTRWDVLTERVNPNLHSLDKLTLARYIGERVDTSIRRNSTVRVMYEDWWLSDTSVLEKLRVNDYNVTAYWMPAPSQNGESPEAADCLPDEIYLFQGDKYIDTCERVKTFNRVMAEQTEEDVVNFIEQRKKIAKFSKYVREHSIGEVGLMNRETVKEIDRASAKAVEVPSEPMTTEDDFSMYMNVDSYKGMGRDNA